MRVFFNMFEYVVLCVKFFGFIFKNFKYCLYILASDTLWYVILIWNTKISYENRIPFININQYIGFIKNLYLNPYFQG